MQNAVKGELFLKCEARGSQLVEKHTCVKCFYYFFSEHKKTKCTVECIIGTISYIICSLVSFIFHKSGTLYRYIIIHRYIDINGS